MSIELLKAIRRGLILIVKAIEKELEAREAG